MNMVTIRASSLAELFDCPARWEAKHLLGMKSASSGAAQLGTAIHASTALYDESRLPGGSPLSIDDCAGALVDTLHNPEHEVDWEDASPRDAEKIGLALHSRYCADIAPRQTYIGVEVACEKLEITDLGIALTGTTDRVRQLQDGSIGIADLKTGGRSVGADGVAVTSGHGPQLGVYELLAEQATSIPMTAPAQIIGLNTGKTAAAQRVGTGEIANTRIALIGDEDSPGLLEYASRLIHSGGFYGNSKSVLCSARYCPRHPVCKYRG